MLKFLFYFWSFYRNEDSAFPLGKDAVNDGYTSLSVQFCNDKQFICQGKGLMSCKRHMCCRFQRFWNIVFNSFHIWNFTGFYLIGSSIRCLSFSGNFFSFYSLRPNFLLVFFWTIFLYSLYLLVKDILLCDFY